MSYWITVLTLPIGGFPWCSPWLSWPLGSPCTTCEEYGDEVAVFWVTCQYLDCSDVPSLEMVAAILDPPFCCVCPWGLFACGFPQQTFFAHPGFSWLPSLLWEMQPVFSKSDLIRPANWWHSSHHSTLQAQVQMLFGLSCKLLVASVCVSSDYPSSAPAFHHLPNGEAGCSPHRLAFIFPA